MTALSLIKLGLGKSTPRIWANTRLETSLISAARSFMYSLSIDSKIEINCVVTSSKPVAALTLSFLILSWMGCINSGSSKTSKCASKIAALSAPNWASALFLILVNSIFEASIASLNFSTSLSMSVTFSLLS